MNWLQELREKHGLSQENLAFYLSVSQSTIALAEKNLRELPTAAMLQLAPLLKEEEAGALSGILAALVASQQADDEVLAAKIWSTQMQESKMKLDRAKRKLAAMQQKCLQASQALLLANRLAGQASKEQRTKAFVDLITIDAFETLSKNGKAEQAKLQIDIKMHEAIID
ncbi:helix-turn-helix domain-containing protein [Parasediminibacterium sp. JCM 36343]|uniref:helix-turn-helix domain-containing protein n=1 Tax=Parasediminibacterium sp. JCM 36343 TaxID=3374279 RepID=UPI00397A946F